GDEDFIARLEIERAQHGVEAARRILDEDQIRSRGAKRRRDRLHRLAQRRLDLAAKEPGRIALDPRAPAILLLEHPPRRQPEAAVIEIGKTRRERPMLARGGGRKRQRCRLVRSRRHPAAHFPGSLMGFKWNAVMLIYNAEGNFA